MFKQKLTKQEQADQLDKLKAKKSRLEQGWFCGVQDREVSNKIRYFVGVWSRLPEIERLRDESMWNEYYMAVSDQISPLYSRLKTNSKDTQAIDLMKRVSLTKPNGFDPQEWQNSEWGISYRIIAKKLKDLESPYESEWRSKTGGDQW